MPVRAATPPVSIATWNLEWLVSPATAHAARLACRNGRRADPALRCGPSIIRATAPICPAWPAYARQPGCRCHRLPGSRGCVHRRARSSTATASASRPAMDCSTWASPSGPASRIAAVRRWMPCRSVAAHRAGMTLLLFPDSPRAVELLAVHLKSGCADDALDSGRRRLRSAARAGARARAMDRCARAGALHRCWGISIAVIRPWPRMSSGAPLPVAIRRALPSGSRAMACLFATATSAPDSCAPSTTYWSQRVLQAQVAGGQFPQDGIQRIRCTAIPPSRPLPGQVFPLFRHPTALQFR